MQALESAFRAGAGAVAFLTRVPVGRWVDLDAEDVARGAVAFPVVGAGIGARSRSRSRRARRPPGALLAAALAVAVEALVTGAIHFDALADTRRRLGAPPTRAGARDHARSRPSARSA